MIKTAALPLITSLLFIVSCAHNTVDERQSVTYCKDPRPQMCTRDYRPVCGLTNENTTKTYGNACGACGDINVSQHITGKCQ